MRNSGVRDRLAVIGLGLMGSTMSRRLLAAGFELRGYDTDAGRRREFAELGGEAASSPRDAVQGCWAALLSLPDSDVSRRVCLGEGGLVESSMAGLVVYDTTTGRVDDAVEIAVALGEVGITYSDTTLSGNSAMAARGDLVVMVGGSEDAYRRGIPLFEAIGRSRYRVGDVGAGTRMKLLVNHILTIHRLALAEGLVGAELAGMDLDIALEVLRDSAAYSRAMDIWGRRMIEGDHFPPASRIRQGHKDARVIVEQASGLAAPVDLVSVVRAALEEGERGGLGEADQSAVIEVLRRQRGIGRV